ncbi:MAG: hypothetical protein PHG03_00120 [Bacilli bacterium]|nr:hypothetical protein [Bacilli bacterium]MDD4794956.1 hypothetical protein [Bacilli bacterium]
MIKIKLIIEAIEVNLTTIKYLCMISLLIVCCLNFKKRIKHDPDDETAKTFRQQDWKVNRFNAKHIVEKNKKKKGRKK